MAFKVWWISEDVRTKKTTLIAWFFTVIINFRQDIVYCVPFFFPTSDFGKHFFGVFWQYFKMHCAKKPLLAASSTLICIFAGLLYSLLHIPIPDLNMGHWHHSKFHTWIARKKAHRENLHSIESSYRKIHIQVRTSHFVFHEYFRDTHI